MAINYQMDVVNPLEAAVQGLQLGQGFRQMQERSALAQQQSLLIQAQQAEALAKQRQVEQEIAAAQRLEADLSSLYDKLDNNTARPSDFLRVIAGNPQLTTAVQNAQKEMPEAQRRAQFDAMLPAWVALERGDMGVFNELLNEQIVAADNSGQSQLSDAARAVAKLASTDPTSARETFGILLAATDAERFKATGEAFEAFMNAPSKRQEAALQVEKLAADLGLTQAQTAKVVRETQEVGARIGEIGTRIEAAKNAGGGFLPPEDQFKAERDMREEVTKRSANFNAAREAFSQMEISRRAQTGAGDIALITQFRKVLDPTSVVRETEFAQAQNIGGLLDRLDSFQRNLTKGQLLNETQREEIVRLGRQFMEAANADQRARIASYNRVINNYGLNPENIFLGAPPAAPAAQPTSPAAPTPAARPARFGDPLRGRIAPSQAGAQPTGRIIGVRKAGE